MSQATNSSEPFCGNCGYILTGLTGSSKCPECGKPIVDVLQRKNMGMNFGKRYRSKATIFGMPVIDIAMGPKNGEMRGHARGFIAIGDEAMGVLAIGGIARGIVAIGGVSLGVFSTGGVTLGLLIALGGLSFGGIAVGGVAIGAVATGGLAIGWVAQGGMAIGDLARGGNNFSSVTSRAAEWQRWEWLLGKWPPDIYTQLHTAIILGGTLLGVLAIIGLMALIAMRNEE